MPISRPRLGPLAAGAAVLVALPVVFLGGCGESGDDPTTATPNASGAPITSTTRVAGANVLGNDRRPDESCPADPPPPAEGPERREVRHAAGSTGVVADPRRIVVLSGDQLDALCALGMQSRIVAAAVPDGSQEQPSYLGSVIHDLPAVGSETDPDLDAIREADPDLILGSEGLTPGEFGDLSRIAPTVFTGPPGPGWQDTLRTVAAAVGRDGAATPLLEGFDADAKKRAAQNDTTHFQASVVRLMDDTAQISGIDDFPGSVLAIAGVDRPAAQRFTDKPYVEVGTADLSEADFTQAEGDVVFVSFGSPAARQRAREVLDSEAWRRLSASKDGRVFVVNDEVWQSGEGIVAARAMLPDLRFVNSPVN
ncbi:MAG: iron-siderophore ABC transporter substrate-binding protein [Mycolicibacterium sp.]|nr:iron-siderophore ABC transporter substrate-binding protein [Mycolicibacterium sp.]